MMNRYWQWFDQQNLEALLLILSLALMMFIAWVMDQERQRKP